MGTRSPPRGHLAMSVFWLLQLRGGEASGQRPGQLLNTLHATKQIPQTKNDPAKNVSRFEMEEPLCKTQNRLWS